MARLLRAMPTTPCLYGAQGRHYKTETEVRYGTAVCASCTGGLVFSAALRLSPCARLVFLVFLVLYKLKNLIVQTLLLEHYRSMNISAFRYTLT